MKRFLIAALSIALFSSAANAQDKVSLRLNWLLQGVHAIFYLGKERGLYAAEGIDLTIGEGQGSARTVQVVATGGDTFGLADGGSIIAGATRGAPIMGLVGVLNKSPFALSFRADAGVKTIKDVEGKTIAVTPGEASLPLLPAIWKANGVDGSKVRLLNVDGPGKLVAVLEKRTEGLLAGLEGQVVVLNNRGLQQTVLAFADLGVNTQGLVIFANQTTIKDKADLTRRFVRATVKAMELARAEPDAAVDVAVKVKPDVDRKLLRDQLDVSITLFRSPEQKDADVSGSMAPADWQRTLDLMKQYQDVSTTMTIDSFFTNSFVTK